VNFIALPSRLERTSCSPRQVDGVLDGEIHPPLAGERPEHRLRRAHHIGHRDRLPGERDAPGIEVYSIQKVSDHLLHPGGGTPNDPRDLADAGGRLWHRVQQRVRADLNGGERIAEIVRDDPDRELAGGHGALASTVGTGALQLEADAVGKQAAKGEVVGTVEIRRLDAQRHQPPRLTAEPNRHDHPVGKPELAE
jgi:hypothetical protein